MSELTISLLYTLLVYIILNIRVNRIEKRIDAPEKKGRQEWK